jgi:putative nucleotidyltransferase with HDIG domain
LRLRKILIENIKEKLNDTTWRRGLAGVVYFLLFTALLSSSLFISKLHLNLGEPSPELIVAPWDKDIEDLDKYMKDQEEVAKATPLVYKADDNYLAVLALDLEKSFLVLHDLTSSETEERSKIVKLRQTPIFASLSDPVLTSLVKLNQEELNKYQQTANQIIISNARNVDTGARSDAEAASLRDRINQELERADLPESIKLFIQTFVEAKVTTATLIVDEQATEKQRNIARSAVKLEVHRYKTNQKIVGPGEKVDETIYGVLTAYGLVDNRNPWRVTGGIALIVLCGIASILVYVLRYKQSTPLLADKLVLVGLTMGLALILGKGIVAINLGGVEFNNLAGMLIPVSWATMTVAILVDIELAFIVAVILAVFTGVMVDPDLANSFGKQVGLVALFGGFVGVHSVSRLSQRSDVARAGIFVSAGNIIVISGLALMSGMRPIVWAVGILLGCINGLFSSVFTVGTLHWFESAFNITSTVRLLELSNPNLPLLKRLLMEAPGTYHHSILVGNLAVAAAESVHADATLVRVGSMYHDIGKLKRPYFFIENQVSQDNPHDKIAPTLSALIITSHLKDGLELAKEYKLPEPIQDIISQHHGDSLIGFFFHKAREENEEVPEEAFHYEAPRPQSKEAALVCLADSVEAAVRSLQKPTSGIIEGLVRKIIKDKLNDGQLDKSNLTLQDLDRIAIAFVTVLSGIFHSRVEYPDIPASRENGQDSAANKKSQEDKLIDKKDQNSEEINQPETEQ